MFWGLAAAALVGFLIYDANKKPSYSPRPSSTTGSTPGTSQPSFSPSSSASSQLEEQMPPTGTNRVLNKSEIRYCIFQGERLNILRDLVSSNREIDRFNGLVSDFNSRCSSFRYCQDVLQATEAEALGRRQNLQLEVQRLLSSWRGSPSSLAGESLADITSVSGAMLVQSRLKELGYYAGVVDGIWGPTSRTALRGLQVVAKWPGLRRQMRSGDAKSPDGSLMGRTMGNSKILAHLAVEYWKLLRAFERTIHRLPQEHVAKTAAQLKFSAGRLDSLLKECGLNLVTFDGQKFEPNIPATALNIEDFAEGKRLTIESTVEPAVVEKMTVLLLGKVVLRKIGDGGCDVSGN